jgi:hypothetical protein
VQQFANLQTFPFWASDLNEIFFPRQRLSGLEDEGKIENMNILLNGTKVFNPGTPTIVSRHASQTVSGQLQPTGER